MSSLWYFFKESLKSFKRNFGTTFGSIVTIFLSLMIIGVFLVASFIVNNIISSVEDKVSITAYVSDDAEQSSIDAVIAEIQSWDGVQSVGFTTKEEALENFSNSNSSNPEIVEQLDGTNPLPASIDIQLDEAQDVTEIADKLTSDSSFAQIADEEDPADSLRYGQDTVEKLLTVVNIMRYVGAGLIILLIFIALVFINNTIRLAILARRKEIAIMRLVGASNGFIRGPFLMESAVNSVIGAGLAIAVIEVCRRYVLPKVATVVSFLPVTLEGGIYLRIYLGLLLAGLFIGLIGSIFAMRRYLKV